MSTISPETRVLTVLCVTASAFSMWSSSGGFFFHREVLNFVGHFHVKLIALPFEGSL